VNETLNATDASPPQPLDNVDDSHFLNIELFQAGNTHPSQDPECFLHATEELKCKYYEQTTVPRSVHPPATDGIDGAPQTITVAKYTNLKQDQFLFKIYFDSGATSKAMFKYSVLQKGLSFVLWTPILFK
jgi:hypothetical protein